LINRLLFSLFGLFLFQSCNSEAKPVESSLGKESQNNQVDSTISVTEFGRENLNTEEYSVTSMYTEEYGWGYIILNQGKPYIKQPYIPAISGKKGFENEQDALLTGDFALQKILNGIMPPSLSEIELDSLGVLN
jgi:Domain of unknown function (DUF4907)